MKVRDRLSIYSYEIDMPILELFQMNIFTILLFFSTDFDKRDKDVHPEFEQA